MTFLHYMVENLIGQDKKLEALRINCEIESYRYDKGEPNHILQVKYEGQNLISRNASGANIKKPGVKIKKGATLKFVLSKSEDALISIPDWTCERLNRVRFLSRTSRLKNRHDNGTRRGLQTKILLT